MSTFDCLDYQRCQRFVMPSASVGLSDSNVICRSSMPHSTGICSLQLPSAFVQVLTCTGWQPLRHMQGLVGSPPLRTWDFPQPMHRVFCSWAFSPLLWMENLCLIVWSTSEAVSMLASRSPYGSALAPFGCSRTERAGGSLLSDFALSACLVCVGLVWVPSSWIP